MVNLEKIEKYKNSFLCLDSYLEDNRVEYKSEDLKLIGTQSEHPIVKIDTLLGLISKLDNIEIYLANPSTSEMIIDKFIRTLANLAHQGKRYENNGIISLIAGLGTANFNKTEYQIQLSFNPIKSHWVEEGKFNAIEVT